MLALASHRCALRFHRAAAAAAADGEAKALHANRALQSCLDASREEVKDLLRQLADAKVWTLSACVRWWRCTLMCVLAQDVAATAAAASAAATQELEVRLLLVTFVSTFFTLLVMFQTLRSSALVKQRAADLPV